MNEAHANDNKREKKFHSTLCWLGRHVKESDLRTQTQKETTKTEKKKNPNK